MSIEAARLFLNRLIEVEPRAYFVGGCVRDALLGVHTYDVDVSIESDVFETLEKLALAYPNTYHIKFSALCTAQLKIGIHHIDIASFRDDHFPSEDGLPVTKPGTLETDMMRRDFTVNTGYVLISNKTIEEILTDKPNKHLNLYKSHPNMLMDLKQKQLVVMHEKSFLEDASRMLRAVKYMHVLDFKLSSETQRLFIEAQMRGVIQKYSMSRFVHILSGFLKLTCGLNIIKTLAIEGLLTGISSFTEQQFNTLVDQVHQISKWVSLDSVQLRLTLVLKLYEHQLALLSSMPEFKSPMCLKHIERLKNELAPSKLWYFNHFNKEDVVVKAFLLIASDVSQIHKSQILYDHMHFRHIQLAINGNDVIEQGIEQGKEVGILLQRLLEEQLINNRNYSRQEALEWLYQYKMKE